MKKTTWIAWLLLIFTPLVSVRTFPGSTTRRIGASSVPPRVQSNFAQLPPSFETSHPSASLPAQPKLVAVSEVIKPRVMDAYGKLPLSFEVNRGQTDSRAKFVSRGSGYNLFLTPTEAILMLRKPTAHEARHSVYVHSNFKERVAENTSSTVLRMRLVDANDAARISGLRQLPGNSNYFIGDDPKKWRTNVPNYSSVKVHEVYPGVDLVYYGNQRHLEEDFVVAPGADPRVVTIAIAGARNLFIDAQGELVLTIPGGEVHLRHPVIYQRVSGVRHEIAGGYKLKRENQVGFELGEYDVRRPLVIDPVLVYSTYLGGNSVDEGIGIAVDSFGSAYVTGATLSTNFPTTPGAFQATPTGASFVSFVTKLNPTGAALVYSTYLGGSSLDVSSSIGVDSSGNAYVTGRSDSNDFPTTPGAFQTASPGVEHSFVTKLNPTGSALVFSTYLGGNGFGGIEAPESSGTGIALDSAGNTYVIGWTTTTNFPTTAGAFQTTLGGGLNAFVTKLNPTGSALVYSTYLGGSSSDDLGFGIGVDSSGNAYVTGETRSSDFPTTAGAFQTALSGTANAFVTKLNSSGSALVYSTYLGGSSFDEGQGIVVDSFGNAYVTGDTDSTNFPTTAGAFQTASGGVEDAAFVTKLNPTGSALVYSTYLGGSGTFGRGIGVDSLGDTYVTGTTFSTNFPTTAGAFQTALGGTANAFVTKLNSSGSALVYSTYLGGSGNDQGQSIGVDSSGDAYVTGGAGSTDFPTTPGAFQTASGGVRNAFISKFAFGIGPPTDIDQCKKDGWATFTIPRKFKNQGDCVSFVTTGK